MITNEKSKLNYGYMALALAKNTFSREKTLFFFGFDYIERFRLEFVVICGYRIAKLKIEFNCPEISRNVDVTMAPPMEM